MLEKTKLSEIEKLDAFWRASNYLSACQLYLLDNPLLERPLVKEDIKRVIVGHWGTVPGQNFIYTHLNRIIKKNDLNMIYLSGPGHGGNAMVAQTYLEGTYSEIYPNITEDKEGLKKLFKQFSFPGGIQSHVAPETPGSIHEGGELGYSLAHAFGAVLDNPDLIAACVVGDGEAETGPLATSWMLNRFLHRENDGVVLPILHLNGYKIANPTLLSRIDKGDLNDYLSGAGWKVYFVEGSDPMEMHQKMITALDKCVKDIKKIKSGNALAKYPMVVLRTPKGWTGPKVVDGKEIENTFRAHQVPITMDKASHLKLLEDWLRSYKPEELFDENGKVLDWIKEMAPKGDRRMGANPYANGGKLLQDLRVPDFRNYAIDVYGHGARKAQDMTELGKFVRDIIKNNPNNFKVFGPDETMSNKLGKVFEVTNRSWGAERYDNDEFLATEGRVMDSMLSEHVCEGMLEGYLLTGRHGVFNSYEAFIRIIDSMAAQHAKWLKVCNDLNWRADIASLNLILSSHTWAQRHNGFTHQDPGFLDHIANKKPDVVRMYLPPDTNCLLSCFDHCIKTKNYVNVLVTSKHDSPQWLSMDEAVKHCTQGIGIWNWASNDNGEEPDVVMACAGDAPTLETLAAVKMLRERIPNIKIRVINVVDLFKLQSNSQHPHGLTDDEYDMLFTKDKPIIFAFHGYPTLVHELTYYRNNRNMVVKGYNEEGTITTAFDMKVQNEIDRFNLVKTVLYKLPQYGTKYASIIQEMNDKLVEHKQYINEYGVDLPEIEDWKW